jgi:flagellar brake protein
MTDIKPLRKEISIESPVMQPIGRSPTDNASMQNEFRITNPKAIGNVLRELMNRKEFLTVECANRSRRFDSGILEVNQNQGYLVYRGSRDPVFNQVLLDAEENCFSATQDGILIEFVGGRSEKHEFDGEFALCAQFPESLCRMQRRELFRIKAPLMAGYCCTAIVNEKHPVVFEVLDVSVKGVALRSSDAAVAVLPIGTVLSAVVLRLGKQSPIETDIKIMNSRISRNSISPVYDFGCSFENFPRAREMELQRFIIHAELARLNMETK